MPRSMTGYGAARAKSRRVAVEVEARSVNSRSLKVTLRTPTALSAREPDLEALVRKTHETATLEVLIGNEVLILDGAEGPSLVGASTEIGTRWPAHATSTGKVLLADRRALRNRTRGPNTTIRRNRRRLRAFTPRTITDPVRLDLELSRTLSRGWASAVEELEAGYRLGDRVIRPARVRVSKRA